jgi:hypothetical protein
MGRTRRPIIATSLSIRLETAIGAVHPNGLNVAVLDEPFYILSA